MGDSITTRISPSAAASPSPAPSAISRVRLCAIFNGMASPPSSNTCKAMTHGFVHTPGTQVVVRLPERDRVAAQLEDLAQWRRLAWFYCFASRCTPFLDSESDDLFVLVTDQRATEIKLWTIRVFAVMKPRLCFAKRKNDAMSPRPSERARPIPVPGAVHVRATCTCVAL